jgi:hypothetical protein
VLAHERRSHTLWDTTRVCKSGSQVTKDGHEAEEIVGEAVEQSLDGEGDSLDELVVDYFLAVPVEDVCPVPNILSVHD